METTISSKTKTVIIGPDRPFTIIGERINPTGRKLLAQEMTAGDFSRVEKDALSQVANGAPVLDVNAGIPMIDEPEVLAKRFNWCNRSPMYRYASTRPLSPHWHAVSKWSKANPSSIQ